MDDDPWGSAKDLWSTSTDDVIPIEDAVPAGQAIARLSTPTLTLPLPATATAASFVEDDPWSRPSDKALSPAPAMEATLPSDITQISDVPPPAKWDLEERASYNTWTSTETVPEQILETILPSGQAVQLIPEQIPLPGADSQELDVLHPVEEMKAKGVVEAGWRTSEDEEIQTAVPGLPNLPEISLSLVVEDETFNPFSQNEGPTSPMPEKPVDGFARSSFDDDAFGGFSAGPNDGFQSGAGFGGSEEGDVNQGWGNQEESSISAIDAPWGMPSNNDNIPDHDDDDDKGFQSSSAAYGQSAVKDTNVNDEDGFHSVPSKEREAVSAEKLKQDDWEAARREIEMKEARAPAEMVNKLVNQWKDVMEQVFPPSASLETGKDVEDGMDMETTIRRDRNLVRLTELPAGMSINFQPVTNTVTWERYQDYVANMKLDPSSSILAKASAEYSYRVNRRKSQEHHDAWQSRSRLGESREVDQFVQQQQSTLSPDLDTSRSRWSFWGRKTSTPTIPLTTSGGGMLEIKNLDLIPAANTAFDKPGIHIGNQRTPSPSTAQLTPPLSSRTNPANPNPSPQPDATVPDAQPSAVGRFLGKLRRTRPQSSSVDVDNKDMQLTQDDFSFLTEVPSLAPRPDPAFEDLLSLNGDGRPSETISSLEAMLNSKPMPLPSKLALTPRPSVPRGSSSPSANVAVPPLSKSSSMMNLFGDLDLNATSASSSKPWPSTGVSSFEAPSPTNQPINATTHRSFLSPPIPPPLPQAGPVGHSTTFDPVSLTKALTIEDDGFGDFAATSLGATPNATSAAPAFDDFGDFEQFDTVPVRPNSQTFPVQSSLSTWNPQGSMAEYNPYSSSRVLAKSGRPSSSRLDHTSTAQLVSEAARNTRQWPAPPSPSVPALPPPTSSRNTTIFPNAILAAPASASSSRASTPLNFDFLTSDPPVSSSARVEQPSTSPAIINTIQPSFQMSKGQGLTASDLSFFDSL
ncbi:hypothetical protein QFC21_000266 [Naganishia friedmannii]|uniref:Uncharacterized protein n=1 Tax=Naganishia friedmannii TaxID=89922 RepID=A0ACC2WCP5_9TREE|nr:hypothetical protein QFC21_000266 [Naganishia friedmannii]